MITFMMVVLLLTAIFLITLVLIQRGRGGGLAGAFGGLGGQSAFGTKAGDMFTKITIAVATFWILLCALTVKFANTADNKFDRALGSQAAPLEGEQLTAPDPARGRPGEPAGAGVPRDDAADQAAGGASATDEPADR